MRSLPPAMETSRLTAREPLSWGVATAALMAAAPVGPAATTTALPKLAPALRTVLEDPVLPSPRVTVFGPAAFALLSCRVPPDTVTVPA